MADVQVAVEAQRGPAEVRPERATQRSTDLTDDLWRLFASPRLALLLILAIATACLAGALITQAPGEVVLNPKAQSAWVAQVRPKYGVFTDIFQFLQLFWVFQTTWFRGLLGLLAINTVVCTINRLPDIWRAAFRPVHRPAEGLFERGTPSQVVELHDSSFAAALPTARRALRGYHVVESPEPQGIYLYADRNRLARFGTLFTHSALLLLLLGVVLSGPLGAFEEPVFAVPIGATRDVGHDTGLSLAVDDFTDEYYPETGAPKDYRADVTLYDSGRQVAQQTVRVNEPLIYNGVRFHQSFFGPAAQLSITDRNGTPLFADAVALTMRSTDDRPVGAFYLADRELSVYVIGPSGDRDPMLRPGQVAIEAYRGGSTTPALRATLSQRQPTGVGDLQFTFLRESQFTGLRVVRDPAVPIIWIASALLILGLATTFYFPHRKLWARLQPVGRGVQITVVGAGEATAPQIRQIAQRLAEPAPDVRQVAHRLGEPVRS